MFAYLMLFSALFNVEHWLALWFRNPYVAGSNPAEVDQGYELFREIALKIDDFFYIVLVYFCLLCLHLTTAFLFMQCSLYLRIVFVLLTHVFVFFQSLLFIMYTLINSFS